MSANKPHAPHAEDAAQAVSVEEPNENEGEPQPQPEPWTPQRVLEWNRYYDLYIAAAVLLLVFLGSAHRIISSVVWTDIQAGRLILERGPLTRDVFSYTMEGKPWVNVPWLFDAGSALLYDFAHRLGGARADQVAAGALVVLAASLRVLTALLILGLRRPGPGLWWSAVCAGLALGGTLMPIPGGPWEILPRLGGVAGPAAVGPETWGLALLALELLLIHRAWNLGRRGALYALVPLFLLWANVDESFLFGLALLAARVVGDLLGRLIGGKGAAGMGKPDGERRPPSPAIGLIVLAAGAAACLINPSFAAVYPTALTPYLELFRASPFGMTADQLSYFGPKSRDILNGMHDSMTAYRLYAAYYVVLVGLGLGSFWLNRRRFSIGRFLGFALASALYAALASRSGEFALVLAATLALNGQEWYLGRHGDEGRIGWRWTAWSVGGRVVTLLAVFALVAKGLTGYGAAVAELPVGFGYSPEDFPFEAARYLGDRTRGAKIEGRVLNLTLAQGDALIWEAWPRRESFIDGRARLFPDELRAAIQDLRRALRKGDAAAWRPILDRYGVSVLMVPSPEASPAADLSMFVGLVRNEDWIPFYDDGAVILFGRADAPEGDLAYFRENALDAHHLAFVRGGTVPAPDRTPTPRTWIDRAFPNRWRRPTQPHVYSAQRWLSLWRDEPQTPPDLADCLLAIREARTALASNPDEPDAWRVLNVAYRALTRREALILERAEAPAAPAYSLSRYRQRVAVLNYAIQTTPPPDSPEQRFDLGQLNYELSQLFLSAGVIDLARERLHEARRLYPPDRFPADAREQIIQLDRQMERIDRRLNDLAAEQQAGPVELAGVAMETGAIGRAIRELEEADASGINVVGLKARLLDLYCQVGEPDRYFDLSGVASSPVEDPALYTEPGTPSYRQGLVNFLIGNYDLAASLWSQRAIPQLRVMIAGEALSAGQMLTRGGLGAAAERFVDLPARVENHAVWEYELGFCLLENGEPARAAEHLAQSLLVTPNLAIRPLLEHYLKELGHDIPPAPAEDEDATEEAAPTEGESAGSPAPADADAKAAESPAEPETAEPDGTTEALPAVEPDAAAETPESGPADGEAVEGDMP